MQTRRITILLSATILLGALSARAEDPVNIPDPALKAAIEAALGIPNPTPSDMLVLTEFNAVGKGIADLTGLEHATNLRYLNLQGSQIADITPLAGLTGMVHLEVDGNPLRGQIGPLASLTNLEHLNAAGCGIADLRPLVNMKKLSVLLANNNQIQDVTPLAGLTEMRILSLCTNLIGDISPLAGLTEMSGLSISSNHISDLSPLAGLGKLATLNIGDNQISDLAPLAGLTDLVDLRAGGNQISDTSPLSNLTNLTRLWLTDNHLTDIGPLGPLTVLTELYLDNNAYVFATRMNQLADISVLANLVNLKALNLGCNQVVDVTPLGDLTNLTWLNLAGNKITDIGALSSLPNLETLRLDTNHPEWRPSNVITDISALAGMTNLRELNLNGNPLPPKACVIDIPLIKVDNPGIVIHYDGCVELPQMLTVSSTPGGSVVMPGEDVFAYLWGELGPVEAVADEGYEFTHWSGTAVDANAMLDPCVPHTSVFMDADYSLTAHFKPQDEPWSTVYFNDFEDQVGPEWSHDLVEATPVGERRFLGQLGNDTVTLALQNLPPHTQVAVSFDLFIIRSWDGYLHPASPDLWSLNVRDGEGLISTTFDNHHRPELNPPPENHRQSYPEEFGTGDFLPQTGAAERNSLGYEFVWQTPTVADAVYCLKLVFAHSDDVLQLDLQASGLEELENESWGLDNVRVEVFVPVPEVTLTTASTPGGTVVMPGEGTFTYDWGTWVPVEAVADEGYQFTHWTGAAVDANVMLDSSVIHTSVLMDADYSLTAHFEPQEESWSTAYFNDFEDQIGSEWSHDLIDASPLGERLFLGQFNTNVVTLTLADLPAHSDVKVSFDLFVIRSWDGDGLRGPRGVALGGGPDLWSLEVGDGPTLLQTTFDNHNTEPYLAFHRQSYPFEYSYGESLPQTDVAEINTLGYVWDFPDTDVTPCDSVYHLECAFPHTGQDLQLVFSALLTEAMNDESWGLDNVRVEVLVPVPNAVLTVSSTAGGSVVVPGEGTFPFGQGESVAIEAVAEAGYSFTHWSGSAVDAGTVADPAAAGTSVLMDGDCELLANFTLNHKTLTISSTTGGDVLGPGEGAFQFAPGESVIVQASTDQHYYFMHWSGTAVDAGKVANPNSQYTTVVMDADYTLVANFRIGQHQLTVSAGAGGDVKTMAQIDGTTMTWLGDVSILLDHGTPVTLTAIPDGGWFFVSWSGMMGSTELNLSFVLTQDCSLEAIFDQ